MDNPTPTNRAGIGGPKTEAGKAASSQNAIKHGLTGKFRIMTEFGESQEKYSGLLQALRDEHQPVSVTEDFVVQRIAQSMVLIERGQLMITEFITPFEPITMERIQRYVTTHDRTFHRSLAELRKLRKDREFLSQNRERAQFVPQTHPAAEFVSQNAAAAGSSVLADPRTPAPNPSAVSVAPEFVSQKPATATAFSIAQPARVTPVRQRIDEVRAQLEAYREELRQIRAAK